MLWRKICVTQRKWPKGMVRGMYALKSEEADMQISARRLFQIKEIACAEILRQGCIHHTQENKIRTVTQECGLCVCCGK